MPRTSDTGLCLWFKYLSACFTTVAAVLLAYAPALTQLESPRDFTGGKIGADKQILDWQTIVDYFKLLSDNSGRVQIENPGQTTRGEPFLIVHLSSPHNIQNLAKYRNLQKQAAHARHLNDKDVKLLARENVAVVLIVMNATSDAVASTQTALELAYFFAADRTPETEQILDNLLILLVPCMNPDGLQRVTAWYEKYRDTAHDSSPLTELSHPYAGDHYKYDWASLSLPETRMLARQIYSEWFPHVVYEQTEATDQQARFLLQTPPAQSISPVLRQTTAQLADVILAELDAQGLTGLDRHDMDLRALPETLVQTAIGHNQIALQGSVANVLVATPLYYPRGSITPGPLRTQPWTNGWWRLRDVIDYELAAIKAMLRALARDKQALVYNFCRANLDAIARGEQASPQALMVPTEQHDEITAQQFLQILMQHGLEIDHANLTSAVGKAGARTGYLLRLAQSFSPFLQNIFDIRAGAGGSNHQSDAAAGPGEASLSALMGVRVLPVDLPVEGDISRVQALRNKPKHLILQVNGDYLIEHESNRSFIAVNRLLRDDKRVYWLKDSLRIENHTYPRGTIFVPAREIHAGDMDLLARELSLDMRQVRHGFQGVESYRLNRAKIGVYQSWIPNPDEGWTRLALEQFEFEFEAVYSSAIRNGEIKGSLDALVLPDMDSGHIIHGWQSSKADAYKPHVPRSYLNGITDEGIESLRNFVLEGGTLIALGRACDFAVAHLGLPVEQIFSAQQPQMSCGRFLDLAVYTQEPLAYGMPAKTSAILTGSQIFRPLHWRRRTNVVATIADIYPELASGSTQPAGLSVVLDIPQDKGRVILFGIRPQYQGMTAGTLKLLFNALHLSRAEPATL